MPAYTPPGVKVTEIQNPVPSTILSLPALVALVGRSPGIVARTDAVTLSGTTAVALPGAPLDATMVLADIKLVMNATNPADAPSGYTVAATGASNATQVVFDATAHTVARNATATAVVPDGATVYITYTYIPADFYKPILLDNMTDIEARFGTAFDSTGTTINSRLTLGAQIAFENGAQQVVLLPLFYNNTGVKQQPTDAQAAAAATWADNFVALRDIEDINVIIPVVGQSDANVGDSNMLAISQALQDHIHFMKTEQQYSIGVTGEDSSASTAVAQAATLQTHAATIAGRYGGADAENMVLVSPSKFSRVLPSGSAQINVGGQYVACAIGGMLASRDVSQTLTRKIVSGFSAVTDSRTKAQMNTDAGSGLCVVYQRNGAVTVRHAVTSDTSSAVKREISIVRAKHRVIESVRDTIDSQIIGQVIADGDAPSSVAATIAAVLEQIKQLGDIVDYSDVQARTLTIDPTTIEVRFSYKPAFPVNYVNIVFALDLTTGDLTVPTTN
jgi:hypothetical protein